MTQLCLRPGDVNQQHNQKPEYPLFYSVQNVEVFVGSDVVKMVQQKNGTRVFFQEAILSVPPDVLGSQGVIGCESLTSQDLHRCPLEKKSLSVVSIFLVLSFPEHFDHSHCCQRKSPLMLAQTPDRTRNTCKQSPHDSYHGSFSAGVILCSMGWKTLCQCPRDISS